MGSCSSEWSVISLFLSNQSDPVSKMILMKKGCMPTFTLKTFLVEVKMRQKKKTRILKISQRPWPEPRPSLSWPRPTSMAQASDFEGRGRGKLSLASGFQAEPSWHITSIALNLLSSVLPNQKSHFPPLSNTLNVTSALIPSISTSPFHLASDCLITPFATRNSCDDGVDFLSLFYFVEHGQGHYFLHCAIINAGPHSYSFTLWSVKLNLVNKWPCLFDSSFFFLICTYTEQINDF